MSLVSQPSGSKKQQKIYQSPGAQPLRLLWRACLINPEKVWEKTELLDTLYWIRQASGLSTGLVWGVLPLTGLNAFIGFTIASTTLILLWYKSQRLDEEEYGGHVSLLAEGFAQSLALFMLTWIIVYTVMHAS
ncbi:hypothetical protein WJX74_001155 [Apatococcus lobatus]|uniref:Rab5-interacting protein n=1 Tax=Apatococcus lobatus TaxID=904363 RepID=A0AAW1R342_9CHLO